LVMQKHKWLDYLLWVLVIQFYLIHKINNQLV
jgi:hypothetical protein